MDPGKIRNSKALQALSIETKTNKDDEVFFFNDFDIIDVEGVIGKSPFFTLFSIVQLSYSYLELIVMSFLTRYCQGDGHKLFMHGCASF